MMTGLAYFGHTLAKATFCARGPFRLCVFCCFRAPGSSLCCLLLVLSSLFLGGGVTTTWTVLLEARCWSVSSGQYWAEYRVSCLFGGLLLGAGEGDHDPDNCP